MAASNRASLLIVAFMAACSSAHTDPIPPLDAAARDGAVAPPMDGPSTSDAPTTTDSGTPAPWQSCAMTSDCVLAPNTCCGVCGEATLEDLDAINGTRVDEHFMTVCPVPEPCPRCATTINPDLLATCSGGTCTAIDIRRHAASACTSDTECTLSATTCCACSEIGPEQIVAVSDSGAYSALICDSELPCPPCVPIFPATLEPFCAPDGHCDIRNTATP